MARVRSFSEVIAATAQQKCEAAQTRGHGASDAEKPRDVILAACEAIGDALRSEGFSFQRTGPNLKRVNGDLVFQIHFQSDRNNIAGRRAAVWIHGGVSSRALAKWRRVHPNVLIRRSGPGTGGVAGGQIGNLTEPFGWMEWDLADEADRQGQIADAVGSIRQILLPFFALFDDPATAVNALILDRNPWQSSLVEYALCRLGKVAAEAAGRAYLHANPGARNRFEEAHLAYAVDGLPRPTRNFDDRLAAVAVGAGLDL